MASPPLPEHGVFISFRGDDTRHSFTRHLSAAFHRKGIASFDDEKLPRGNSISKLLEMIERSKIAVVILSEGYANSDWCLDELATIIDRWENGHMEVLPVFYKVRTSDVKNQTGSFGAPFERVEETFGSLAHKVPIWKRALVKVSQVAGYVLSANSPEPDFIERIAADVAKMLTSTEMEGFVGIEPHVKKVEELLRFDEASEVRVVGIIGMIGIGKTTIADILYQQKRGLFTGYCFVAGIRGESGKVGLNELQRKLLCKILEDEKLEIGAPQTAHECLRNRLGNKKVLIVLDDVSDKKQVDLLMGQPRWYGEGTRIIITARDKKLVENVVHETYEVPRLNHRDALQLFSLNAFPNSSVSEREFMDVTLEFLDYAKGNPWILKLLGKDLCRNGIAYWKEKLQGLKRIPDGEIEGLLRISFDELNAEQKNVFLDVACFFRSENVDYIESLLHDLHVNVSSTISDLKNKFLMSISENHIEMHDVLYTLGKEIGLQRYQSDPGKRCRLWNHEDVCHVLKNGTGTEEIRGIFFDIHEVTKMKLQPDVFRRMCNLKFLKIYNAHCPRGCEKYCRFFFPEGLDSLPDALTYLHWHGFPLEKLPSNFNPSKLVDVNLSHSQITNLWEDEDKNTERLKWMDLSFSRNLLSLGGLSMATNLRSLNLEGCMSLSDISSIRYMDDLVTLNLRGCTKLKRLPRGINLSSLKNLILSGCTNLKKLRLVSEMIENLHLDGTAVEELPKSIVNLDKLALLNLKNCNKLKYLPESFWKLTSLKELILSGCSRLESFPEIQEGMEHLEVLLLEDTAIKKIPKTLCLSNLKTFSFSRSRGHDSPGLLLPSLSGSSLLTDLCLMDCGLNKLPDNVGFLSPLQCLCLSRNEFETLPASVKELSLLKWLDLSYCKQLRTLPVLPPNLQYLDAHDCNSLEEVGSPLKQFVVTKQTHSTFKFTNCFRLCGLARCDVVFHTLVISQLMANASLLRYHRGVVLEPLISICYPDTEVPSWFRHRGYGYVMETKLPPHWCDSRFLGFTLCAIVSFKDNHDHSGRFSLRCRCKIRNDGDEPISFSFTIGSWNEIFGPNGGLRPLGSHHVFLSYNSCFHIKKCRGEEKLDNCSHSMASFRFFVTDDTKSKTGCCEVVKCGLNLLYAQDEDDGRVQGIQGRSTDQEVKKRKQIQCGDVTEEAGCSGVRCSINNEQRPRKAIKIQ